MRSEFEKWARSEGYEIDKNTPTPEILDGDEYTPWEAWQASAAQYRELMEKALGVLEKIEYSSIESTVKRYPSETEADEAIIALKQALSEMGE